MPRWLTIHRDRWDIWLVKTFWRQLSVWLLVDRQFGYSVYIHAIFWNTASKNHLVFVVTSLTKPVLSFYFDFLTIEGLRHFIGNPNSRTDSVRCRDFQFDAQTMQINLNGMLLAFWKWTTCLDGGEEQYRRPLSRMSTVRHPFNCFLYPWQPSSCNKFSWIPNVLRRS